jgi:hypothetical protein
MLFNKTQDYDHGTLEEASARAFPPRFALKALAKLFKKKQTSKGFGKLLLLSLSS